MLYSLNPHKVFSVKGEYFLLVSKTGAIFQIDEITLALLRQNGKRIEEVKTHMEKEYRVSSNEFDDYIQQFCDANLLGSDNSYKSCHYSSEHMRGIELMVCQNCNLACKYCYAIEGEYSNPGYMSEDIGKKAIDFLFSHSTSKSLRISFFGGEPLLNFGLIEALVDYAITVANQYEKQVSFAVTTNGTLINRKIAEFLTKHNFYISLSIDGDKNGHDLFRVNKVGTGSYDDAIKMLPNLKSNHITLIATSTPENCNYAHISNALFKLNQSEFFIGEALNCYTTDKSLNQLKHSYDAMLSQFYYDLSLGELDKCIANRVVYGNLVRIANFEKRSCSCSAFAHGVAVDINGDIFPCHRFVGSTYCIGSVLDEKYDEAQVQKLFERDFLLQNRKGCADCWAQNLCVGGCAYQNYVSNGECQIPSVKKCTITLHLLERVITLYLSLSEEQKVKLRLTH